MLVYGDFPRRVVPSERLDALLRGLARVEAMAPGLPRHAALVGLCIEAGELAQGLLDAEFLARGWDDISALSEACGALVLAFGRAVVASWASGFQRLGPPVRPAVAALARLSLPPEVSCKVPEGYAFYALYPEAYLEAARALAAGEAPPRVVGLRSIGTSLAGIVAAASGADEVFTVRPGGPPFQRTLRLSEALASRLLADGARRRFVVVDEGPGLSGSSFGAVGDFLEARGVPPERMDFLPGHRGGLGPHASERHRARWERVSRQVVEFDELLSRPREPPHSLARWVEDVTGPVEGPLEDVGGGGWRRHLLSGAEWPAVHVQQERRKYLARAGGRLWLLKFAGLGREGEHRLERAQALEAAGFGLPVVGLRHGFLVQPWCAEARPLCVVRGFDRRALVARVGEYLGFRARHFGGVADERGASPRRLLEMAWHNTAEALGEEVAAALEAWEPRLPALEREVRRVETDNKVHAWEWLVLPGGRLLKADAVDHHHGHDLVGCQDVAWDLAGAAVELNLSREELAALTGLVARETGHAPSPESLRFHLHCYLAFQLGHHALAATALGAWAPEESERLRRAAASYGARLRHQLTQEEQIPSPSGRGPG